MGELSLEDALNIKVGDLVKAIHSCAAPHVLTINREYKVRNINPFYRWKLSDYPSKNSDGEKLLKVEFGIIDDEGKRIDVSYFNFSCNNGK